MNDSQPAKPAVVSAQSGVRGNRGVLGLILGSLLLIGTVCFIYGRGLHAPFLFDDAATVLNNPSIRQLWPLFRSDRGGGPLNPPKHFPTSARPLVNLSFAINYHFSRLDPPGYRVVNIALHALSAVLLWAIDRRILSLDYFRGQFDRVAGFLSFAAALVWAVHPLNTESVAYLTQRTELMMGFFYLATLYASLRYWDAKTGGSRVAWLIVATTTGVLGMLSKEMMASAIAMVLLCERTFITGSFRRACRESWPLYLGLALGWLPILAINYHGPRTPMAGFGMGVPAHVWWLTQTQVLMMYLKLAFWPRPLSLFYEIPYLTTLSAAWPWLTPVVLGVIGTIVLVWRRTAAGFVATWVLAVLSPTLLIPLPGETAVERRMYVPLAALVPLVVVGGFAMLQRLERYFASDANRSQTGCVSMTAFTAGVVGLSVIFSVACIRRVAVYQDELTIWQDAWRSQKTPLVETNLGTILVDRGRPKEAIKHFEEAIRFSEAHPNHEHTAHAHYNMARVLADMGRPEEALEHYEQAVRFRPDFADAQYNFGLALSSAGRTSEAVEHFEAALRSKPGFASAHNNLGVALVGLGRVAEAIVHFEHAVKLEPDVEGYANLAFAYALVQRDADVIATAQKAIELARSKGNPAMAGELEAWLGSYRSRAMQSHQ